VKRGKSPSSERIRAGRDILFAVRPALAPVLLAWLATPAALAQEELPAEFHALCAAKPAPPSPPAVLYEVAEVVDGDTIHIWRDGRLVKLRLLSVDTEEKLAGRPSANPSKPETVFGHETMLWAQELFRGLAAEGQRPRVGLLLPEGPEQIDAYGRLLCHVLLPDGRDFNLMLVELGKSPYFNKYGNSEICHPLFALAQERARAQELGIWNPATNAPATAGVPAARRPYERLIPWWNQRAAAVERFRELRHAAPFEYVDAQVPAELAAALERGRPVEVFGSIAELFDEPSGDWTLLFSAPEGAPALRVSIPAARRAAFAALDLAGTREEYRQNYLYVNGLLAADGRGFRMRCEAPAAVRLAGPR
jgi:endonuclease YncB( thermonuclease family)